MIRKIREYIELYESIEENERINVEFLPAKPTSYSLVEEPLFNNGKGVGVLRKFLDGKTKREYRVQLQRVAHYEEMVDTNIDNSNFMKSFQKWIEENNKNKIFPEIDGMQKVNLTTNGYIQAVSEGQDLAIYVVGLQFIYIDKGE